jgi:hypothetical protein
MPLPPRGVSRLQHGHQRHCVGGQGRLHTRGKQALRRRAATTAPTPTPTTTTTTTVPVPVVVPSTAAPLVPAGAGAARARVRRHRRVTLPSAATVWGRPGWAAGPTAHCANAIFTGGVGGVRAALRCVGRGCGHGRGGGHLGQREARHGLALPHHGAGGRRPSAHVRLLLRRRRRRRPGPASARVQALHQAGHVPGGQRAGWGGSWGRCCRRRRRRVGGGCTLAPAPAPTCGGGAPTPVLHHHGWATCLEWGVRGPRSERHARGHPTAAGAAPARARAARPRKRKALDAGVQVVQHRLQGFGKASCRRHTTTTSTTAAAATTTTATATATATAAAIPTAIKPH